MLTRHFYEDDEVKASLRWCMRKGRIREALFWCLELLDSEMEDLVQQELYTTWVWYFGIGKLSALLLITSLDTRANLLGFVYGLTRLSNESRDKSTLVLLLYGAIDRLQPDRANGFPCLQPLFQELACSAIEQAFANAVYQGKARLAFDLSRPLWSNKRRVYEILDRVQLIKHKGSLSDCMTLFEFQDDGNSWPTRACAIASACLDKKRLQESLKPIQMELPPDLVAFLEECKELTGRRARRLYPVIHESLYYTTKRGLVSNKESNLKELYEISDKTLEGCPFWNRVLEEEAPWLDDERKEAFYELYFPDDIPDEWSKKDQEKSHGYGCLINKEIPSYAKYIDRWVRDMPARSSWISNHTVRNLSATENDWSTLFDSRWNEIVSTWCLTPVKKRVLVLAEDTSVLECKLSQGVPLPQELRPL